MRRAVARIEKVVILDSILVENEPPYGLDEPRVIIRLDTRRGGAALESFASRVESERAQRLDKNPSLLLVALRAFVGPIRTFGGHKNHRWHQVQQSCPRRR